MPTRLTMALGQMNIALADIKRNTLTVEALAAEAARRGAHLLVLPELWSTGYAWDQYKELSFALNSGLFERIASVATQHNISLVGSTLERRGLEVANSATFFNPKGRLVGVYRKLHLFRLFDEHRYLQPGEASLLMELPWGQTGLAICYDLRFPELFRRYAVEGAKLIIIPAEWPLERLEHWRALLIARAIENQCFIVAVNAAGQTGNTTFAGHSMIVDPWGKIVVEAGEDPMLLTVDIDLDEADTVRQRIPVLEDRRPEAY